MVYALGIEGHKALYPKQWRGSHANPPRDWRQRDRRIRWRAIEHEVTLTEVLLTMQFAAAERGWPLRWSAGDRFRDEARFPRYVDVDAGHGNSARLPLNPDAFVTLDTSGLRLHWFVEIDMSTEPNERRDLTRSSIRQKMLAYQQLNATLLRTYDRRRYRFGVLFVTTTAKRVQGMRALAQKVDAKRKGSHFFLFSTHDRCRLDDAAAVFSEPRWWSAKIGYNTPRRLILDPCPHCHQLVDPSNEAHEVGDGASSSRLLLAPASSPLPQLLPESPVLSHAACAERGSSTLAAFLD
jgi:hypothetical protein